MQILREERLVICQAMTLQIQYAKLQAARETVFFFNNKPICYS